MSINPTKQLSGKSEWMSGWNEWSGWEELKNGVDGRSGRSEWMSGWKELKNGVEWLNEVEWLNGVEGRSGVDGRRDGRCVKWSGML